jgi:hypothetical protein
MRKLLLIVIFLAANVSTCLLLSCLQGYEADIYSCPHPVMTHLDSLGQFDPCCKDNAVPCIEAPVPRDCNSMCLPEGPPPDWSREPLLVWYGPSSQVTMDAKCPDGSKGLLLHTDPLASYHCPSCICGDPSCVLPSGIIASNTDMCQGPLVTEFPATDPDGCSTPIEIKPDTFRSLGLLAPTVSPCAASMEMPTDEEKERHTSWANNALICSGKALGTCALDQTCMMFLPPIPGYMHCIQGATEGAKVTSCPERYPLLFTFYHSLDDEASCTPCKCDPAVGSQCTAEVSAFTDSSCVESSHIFEDYIVPLAAPQCATVPSNTALRGMTEKWVINKPGKCTPRGGEPTGVPIPDQKTSWTFCCSQDQPPTH